MKRTRRRARSMALQILYEVDCAGHKPEEVFANRLIDAQNLGDEAEDFVRRMVLGTYESTEELDQLIASCAPEWPVEELARGSDKVIYTIWLKC